MQLGPGPVFLYECLSGSRRWQTYALRAFGAAVLLAAIATIAGTRGMPGQVNSWREYAALGESYFYAIIGVELTLVMLAAPAATAGAICVNRARGTLTHMLVTELSDSEIVLGKLAARMLPVLGLVACSWPVLAACSMLGGIEPVALTLAFAVIVAVALLGCTMALVLSVWARKPHEVVLVVYTCWLTASLLWPIWSGLASARVVGPPADWTLLANPYYVAYVSYLSPNRLGRLEYLGYFGGALGTSFVLALVAVWRMRPVARRGIDERRREPRPSLLDRLVRRLPGPSLDGNPVLWREWHRSRPTWWVLLLVLLVGGSTTMACVFGAAMVWAEGVERGKPGAGIVVGVSGMMIQLIFGLLMLSAMAPTAMAEERQRGSLDLVAATSLSTGEIVRGKWLGILRYVVLLSLAPGLMALAPATASRTPITVAAALGGSTRWARPNSSFLLYPDMPRGALVLAAGLVVATIVAHGALLASVGLALGTWLKRQGRAIALSVTFAVLIGAGFPILAAMSGSRVDFHRVGGLMALSPVMAVEGLIHVLSSPVGNGYDLHWWTGFWAIECLATALGLLWLTVRTFDGCIGRISERPRRTPWLADVIVVVAGLGAVAGVFATILLGVEGYWSFEEIFGGFAIVICLLLSTLGLLLLCPLSAWMGAREDSMRAADLAASGLPSGARLYANRWWRAFRLVPPLAAGPAVLLLALALAPVPVPMGPRMIGRTATGGRIEIAADRSGTAHVTTMELTGRTTVRRATPEEIAKVHPGPPLNDRLIMAGLAIATILVHGAAGVSLGVALGTAIRGRRRAIFASLALVLIPTVAWPLINVAFGLPAAWGWSLSGVFPALSSLAFRMHSHQPIEELVGWVVYWNTFLAVLAVIAAGLAIRTLNHRARREVDAGAGAEADRLLEPGAHRLAVGAAELMPVGDRQAEGA